MKEMALRDFRLMPRARGEAVLAFLFPDSLPLYCRPEEGWDTALEKDRI